MAPNKRNKPIKMTPFMAFMQVRRKQLQSRGITFRGGWKDVAKAVDEEWGGMTESQKKKWEDRARVGNLVMPGKVSNQYRPNNNFNSGHTDNQRYFNQPSSSGSSNSFRNPFVDGIGFKSEEEEDSSRNRPKQPPALGPKGWFDNLDKDYLQKIKLEHGGGVKEEKTDVMEVLEVVALDDSGVVVDMEEKARVMSIKEQDELERLANYYAPDQFNNVQDCFTYVPECRRDSNTQTKPKVVDDTW